MGPAGKLKQTANRKKRRKHALGGADVRAMRGAQQERISNIIRAMRGKEEAAAARVFSTRIFFFILAFKTSAPCAGD